MELDTQQIIREQLSTGEHLLWSGRPKQGLMLRPGDGLMIPFSLLWGGFAFFWEYMVFRGDAPFFFRLWGIPFVLVGLYFIFGRFLVDAWQRTKTYYGLSEQRAIIVSGLFSRNVRSLHLKAVPEVSQTEHGDGRGTIIFGSSGQVWLGFTGRSLPGSQKGMLPAFERIENAKSVYEMIRKAQAGDR